MIRLSFCIITKVHDYYVAAEKKTKVSNIIKYMTVEEACCHGKQTNVVIQKLVVVVLPLTNCYDAEAE